MVQGYYTLEESANILGMSPDDLKQLARKGDIRSFQDRGTWRFRIQDIQEMARRRGAGSDQDIPLGEAVRPKPTDSPAPRSPGQQKKKDDVFGFSLDPGQGDAGVNLGASAEGGAHGSGKKTGSGKNIAQVGSDSDVRLVADGSDVEFKVPQHDSDVKVEDLGPKSGKSSGPKSPRPGKNKPTVSDAPDSGVRLVAMDSDSDVRIVGADSDDVQVPIGKQPPKGATDSDIRLETSAPRSKSGEPEGMLTEEINLDEELRKDEVRRQDQLKQAKKRPKTSAPDAKKSPFELSESDLELKPLEEDKPEKKGKGSVESSSDFELTPASEKSPLELGSSDEIILDAAAEEFTLVEPRKGRQGPPPSGVNIDKPADSGISLEQSSDASDSIEFELTLDAETTPKPGGSKPSTPKPGAKGKKPEDSDSSEFELSLDAPGAAKSDSDSEFELTLDDGGDLSGDSSAEVKADKDIFETDFEVPALDEESGSEGVHIEDADTDLESSDFELAIGDEDVPSEDESGSQVVALEEEAGVDDAAATVQAKSRKKKPTKAQQAVEEAAEGDFAELEAEDAEAEIEEEAGEGAAAKGVRQTVVAEQAPWGIFPVLVLLPCVVVMVLLGFMSFELVQTQNGFKQGALTKAIGGLIEGKK
jgi:hypothetical protein